MPGEFVVRLLDTADVLLGEAPGDSAFRRRAVSAAYYEVFHALATSCADILVPVNRDADEYARIYRSLDHGPLKSAFASGPMKDRKSLRLIGDVVVRLQAERHRADYLPDPGAAFSLEQAQELLTQAREAVALIDQLDEPNRRTLAVHLLFKARP